ncbi:anthranilate synthase family protein [Streptomyces sp. N2-109]|uniref:anthranilate synthase n=1 Tax=Streptomyces gossypii TaxID=2883101 RepID=A0ABT2JPE4_9ACTN|nr:anthranilate synthase family protein [Streptomyces gossypii]MCT2589748.1 anthranilate synthase family protein [Streptomyces gossypii]
MTGADLLDEVLAAPPGAPFALLHRPEAAGPGAGPDRLDVLLGEMTTPPALADIPLPEDVSGTGNDVLVAVPYRQITERGYACADDGVPLLAMRVTDQVVLPLQESLERIPLTPIQLAGGHFDVDDDAYAEIVRRIVRDEIGRGTGANFVLKRSYVVDIEDYSAASALTLFRRLCELESGAYWTFLLHTGTRTLVGATPERHVSLHGGDAVMNPISGTYRYPPDGPTLEGLMEFLGDGKESDELHMVVDEELKMMARICEDGGRVVGPFLKEMARLAHTEYFIEGRSRRGPREILRETMFAPTVTGSPLESACRVISQYEPSSRGYYSGVLALIGRDGRGERFMDSTILIRTTDIDSAGRVTLGVGSTLVRHSDPASEAAETRAKAAGLLNALDTGRKLRFGQDAGVRAALSRRSTQLGGFWLSERPRAESSARAESAVREGSMVREERQQDGAGWAAGPLAGRRALVVDAEDTFTGMIGHQLRSLGLEVAVRRFDEDYSWHGHDLVVMGPGPGDPRETSHPRIAHLYGAIAKLLSQRRPFLAVCLSHQVLSRTLGLEIERCEVPHQGAQRTIDLFGDRERVGFYNTFAAHSADGKVEAPGVGLVEVSRDLRTGEVHALRGPHFASLQFHAESVLTHGGPRIFADRIKEVLG